MARNQYRTFSVARLPILRVPTTRGYAVPTIYGRREFPTDGGLVSYGASTIDQYRQCGLYVGRIPSGAKPAELPFLQPTKFGLVLNVRAAKALGLKMLQRC